MIENIKYGIDDFVYKSMSIIPEYVFFQNNQIKKGRRMKNKE